MYDDMTYAQLKKLCKERGIKAVGKKHELIEKLSHKSPDWNEDGTWKRRPKGFVAWGEDGKAIVEET